MARTKLSAEAVAERLSAHPDWKLDKGRLHRKLQFADFVAAFGFMVQVALVAEKMNHHPDWSNVYRTVEVFLSTHDVGGISALDFELAAAIDRIAGSGGT